MSQRFEHFRPWDTVSSERIGAICDALGVDAECAWGAPALPVINLLADKVGMERLPEWRHRGIDALPILNAAVDMANQLEAQ